MAKAVVFDRPEDQTTAQRFEAKYHLTENMAQMVLDYMQPYLTTDKNTQWGQAYVINSIYLDNPRLSLFWSSKTGEKNRFKLRIRSYTDKPEDPVFFEIKRRVNQVILKQRAITTRDTVDRILRHEEVPFSAFLKPGPKERENLWQFRDLMEAMGAVPQTMVRYTREAYMSNLEEPVRITFDRNLSALPVPEYHPSVWTYGPHWTDLDVVPVILEIKFTNTFPRWVRAMVQRFGLLRAEFAKYVACMDQLKREGSLFAYMQDHNEDPLYSNIMID